MNETEVAAVIDAIKQKGQQAGQELRAKLDESDAVRKIAEGIVTGNRRTYFSDELGMGEAYSELRTLINNVKITDNQMIAARVGAAGGLQVVTIEQHLQQPPANLAEQVSKNEAETKDVQETELTLEKHFYPYVRQWSIEHGYPNCHITGGQLPGAKWENPDLIDIAFEVLPHFKEISYSVTSFEVKLRVEPYAVWQAAHYLRFSSSVYLVFAKQEDEVRRNDRVLDLAVEFGLGLLILDNTQGSPKFREIQTPRTMYPPAARVNEVIQRFGTREPLCQVLSQAEEERSKLFRIRMG